MEEPEVADVKIPPLDKPDPSKKEPTEVFKGFGFEVPLPKWAIRCIAASLVVGVTSAVALKVVVPYLPKPTIDRCLDELARDPAILADPHVQKVMYDPAMRDRLETVHRLVENMILLSEEHRHFDEPKTVDVPLWNDADKGRAGVHYYGSDGCILILRKLAGGKETNRHWITRPVDTNPGPPPTVRPDPAPPDTKVGLGTFINALRTPVVLAAAGDVQDATPAQACGGRCVNPHPGQFTTWNGQPNGCWLPIWRRWPEGCTHYQWFNTCSGSWDTNPDGTAKVSWTCCAH